MINAPYLLESFSLNHLQDLFMTHRCVWVLLEDLGKNTMNTISARTDEALIMVFKQTVYSGLDIFI